jgi:hypothetical protein
METHKQVIICKCGIELYSINAMNAHKHYCNSNINDFYLKIEEAKKNIKYCKCGCGNITNFVSSKLKYNDWCYNHQGKYTYNINSKRWNKGLTKENNEILNKMSINNSKNFKNHYVSPETCEKISQGHKKHIQEKGHWAIGQKRSIETKNKLSMFQKSRSEQHSKNMTSYWKDGKIKNSLSNYGTQHIVYSKKNNKNFCLRSNMELKFYNFLENSENIENFNYENIRIQYEYNNKQHTYIIDFYIKQTNGLTYLIEVKPSYSFKYQNKELIITKFKALLDYCNINNYKAKIITEKEIDILNDKIKYLEDIPIIL